jgi:Flp pilus assembly protein TadD
MLSTKGVRDVKLAGGTGECRVVVTLEGAVFDPEDSFADQSDDTAYFRRPNSKARSPVDDAPEDRAPSADGPRPDKALDEARALREKGDVRAATELLEEAVRTTPDEPRLLEALGHAYASGGDVERARRAFRQLGRISPDDAQAHLLHAAAAFQCDRLEDARTALAEAIRLDPRNPSAYKYAAKLCDKQGDAASAAKFRAKYEDLKRG